MSRRWAVRIAISLAAVAITTVGLLGTVGYGRAYNLHRGFGTVVQFPRAGTGRLLKVAMYSPALGRRSDYLAYLPPHYDPARRYPVYYLLHGMPGQPRVFVDIANMDVRLDNQLALGRARPMILIYPDGRVGGRVFSDSEWADTRAGAYASYVIDVMHDVDRHFATLPHRQDRVIGGFSAGAYGAMNIALHHLADFANVQAWSGYFTQTRTGVFAHAGPAALAGNSPIDELGHLTARLASDPLRAYLFVGRDDSSSRQLLPMVEALRARGAHVGYRVYPGGHDWALWYPRLNQMLDLASWDIGHLPRRGRAAQRAPPALGRPIAGAAQPQSQPLVPRAAVFAHARHAHGRVRLVLVLLLALLAAALINLGFVLQHRGRSQVLAAGHGSLRHVFTNRSWLSGQALGWVGFAGQIVAVALAPLTLVQAFAAGSLAISVPLAARIVGHRVGRAQLIAVLVVALSLASLPVGFGGHHGHLQPGSLLIACAGALLVATGLGLWRRITAQAVASGVLYGVADAAIKADASGLRVHGLGALASGWTILAALTTFGGFLAFQGALRGRDAVQPLSLMNAFTALTALGLGISGFGESLGAGTVAGVGHVIAIALVLACVWPLTRAQEDLLHGDERDGAIAGDDGAGRGARTRDRGTRRPGVIARGAMSGLAGAGAVLAVAFAVLAGVGLLYSLRQLRWLAAGPPVPDALPLLQLAGFAGQPLARVIAAWLVIGIVAGIVLMRVSPWRRALLCGLPGAVLLLFASDASYALAHNLRLADVLVQRAPGLGPWVQGLLLAAGSLLARPLAVPVADRPPRPRPQRGRSMTPPPSRRRPAMPRRRPVFVGSLAVACAALAAGGYSLGSDRGYARSGSSSPPAPSPSATGTVVRHRRLLVPGSNPSAQLVHFVDRDGGRLLTVDFYSRALRREAKYLVFLPAGYRPSHRLPVFYGLHGMPGRPLAFTVDANIEPRLEQLVATGRVRPMILVFPDGRIHGRIASDSEWANTPSGRFQSYVVDVVHDVDRRFPTLPYRRDRVIAGLSAGAYGAANVGLHELRLFGAIQVWSGYFTETHNGVFAHASAATMAANSPLDYVLRMRRAFRRRPLRIFIYIGWHDSFRSQTAPMAAALRAEGADVHDAVYSGGHSWQLWSAHLDQMLVMAAHDFAHPLRARR